MRFYIIDAFTSAVFCGNPAGVVILPEKADFPPSEVMRKTAAELRYFETAFVKRGDGDSFEIRYFTTAKEVELCGHATIAAYFALMEEGLAFAGFNYRTKTLAGDIGVSVRKNLVIMDMAPPKVIRSIDKAKDIDELYEVMGLSPQENMVIDDEWILYPKIISTGLPNILLPVANTAALERMRPNIGELISLSNRYGAVGVHAFALGEALLGGECTVLEGLEGPVTAYCRNFAPAIGIDEEAATGTSNGALTYYLYKNALIDGGMDCLYIQGQAMKRPSKILGRISPSGEMIQIGGEGAVLARGSIRI
jgi:PhzF family phenazine biosynthesis protein